MSPTMNRTGWRVFGLLAVLLAATWTFGAPQGRAGRGMRGGMMHGDQQADMRLFHELLDNRQHIRRQVTLRPDGVETLTESDVPAVARTIQAHVTSMSARVEDARPIHLRDPLFREIFRNAGKIVMKQELTPRGVRVIETSTDPYVAKLIQAHAEVVSAFIANGHAEMMKDHPLPKE